MPFNFQQLNLNLGGFVNINGDGNSHPTSGGGANPSTPASTRSPATPNTRTTPGTPYTPHTSASHASEGIYSGDRSDAHHHPSNTPTVVVMANRPGDSNTISKNVDGIYKEFTVFQSQLKLLVGLYKDQHKLMKSLHEKRMKTAKCFNEMFSHTPIAAIVAPNQNNISFSENYSPMPSAPPPQAFIPSTPHAAASNKSGNSQASPFRDSLYDRLDSGGNSTKSTGSAYAAPAGWTPFEEEKTTRTPPDDDIEETSYPSMTEFRLRKKEPEEEGIEPMDAIAESGIVQTKNRNDQSSDITFFPKVKEKGGIPMNRRGSDPPDGSRDFPDDEVDADEADNDREQKVEGDHVNIIVEDDTDYDNGPVDRVGKDPDGEKEHLETDDENEFEPETEDEYDGSDEKEPPATYSHTKSITKTTPRDEDGQPPAAYSHKKSIQSNQPQQPSGDYDPSSSVYVSPEKENSKDDLEVVEKFRSDSGITDSEISAKTSESGKFSDSSSVEDENESEIASDIETQQAEEGEGNERKSGSSFRSSNSANNGGEEAGLEETEVISEYSVNDRTIQTSNAKVANLPPEPEISLGCANNEKDWISSASEMPEPEYAMSGIDEDDDDCIGSVGKVHDKKETEAEVVPEPENLKSAPPQQSQVVTPETQISSYLPSKIEHRSYYDVHEVAHKETKAFLEQHGHLVEYVEEWERVVSTRVKARYGEYVKLRKNLNHYIKKVDGLHNDLNKMREKGKPIKPKQEEKMERNEVKLAGARETHDAEGETLFLLIDEVVHRSWRDVYPLLAKTVRFEKDFTMMQANLYDKLNGTAELLRIVGEKDSISSSSRLKSLKTMNPEVIYTGSRGKGMGLPALIE